MTPDLKKRFSKLEHAEKRIIWRVSLGIFFVAVVTAFAVNEDRSEKQFIGAILSEDKSYWTCYDNETERMIVIYTDSGKIVDFHDFIHFLHLERMSKRA